MKRIRKYTTPMDNPPPCEVVYRNQPIIYDDRLDDELVNFFKEHNKTFSFHIKNNQRLFEYMMEVSYPIDYTQLNLETRIKWISEHMQKFPNCPTCGRPIDFKNVKLSHEWDRYCCAECWDKSIEKKTSTHARNSTKMYNKMLNMPNVELLFGVDDFIKRDIYTNFHCRCRLCNKEFYSTWDQNFYRREGERKAYFRCPHCFPLINMRTSFQERKLYDFVCKCVGNMEVLHGVRTIIPPYELDIYIPKLKMAFEFNGLFWHSLEYNAINYKAHLNKTKLCEDKGISLVHIWEDEWRCENDRLKNTIKTMLNGTFDVEKYKSGDVYLFPRDVVNRTFAEILGMKVVSETEINVVKRIQRRSMKENSKEKDIVYSVTDCGMLICKK